MLVIWRSYAQCRPCCTLRQPRQSRKGCSSISWSVGTCPGPTRVRKHARAHPEFRNTGQPFLTLCSRVLHAKHNMRIVKFYKYQACPLSTCLAKKASFYASKWKDNSFVLSQNLKVCTLFYIFKTEFCYFSSKNSVKSGYACQRF